MFRPVESTCVARPPEFLADIPRIVDVIGYASLHRDAPERFRVGGAGAVCYYGPAACAPLVGTELAGWADGLFAHVAATVPPELEDFRVTYAGTSWRVCRDAGGDYGEQWMFRRLPDVPPRLADLHADRPAIRTLLEGPWLNDGGLVLLCGLTGQGKTTLASATVRSRLELFSGRCVTVEDVIEAPLEGVWGRGTCRQVRAEYDTQARRKEGFAGGVRRAYRLLPAVRPAILYIGEVRDVETATEVIKAAANGMLVVTTIHAGNIASALVRLLTLGQYGLGNAAADSLAAGLRLVAHHSLTLAPDMAGWQRGRFAGTAIVSTGQGSELANTLATQRLNNIAAILEYQSAQMQRVASQPMPCEALLKALAR